LAADQHAYRAQHTEQSKPYQQRSKVHQARILPQVIDFDQIKIELLYWELST
jgi:hypothetical protein